MARVIVINRFFHPDLAPTGRYAADLAFHLASSGWEVYAVASRHRYEDSSRRLPASESVRGVEMRRVATTRMGGSMQLGRALDYATFYLGALWWILRLARRGDIVIAKTDPPLMSVGAALAALLTGARLVNWHQDIFPEAASRMGLALAAGPLGWCARRLRDFAVRRAAANVVLGERMAAELARLVPGCAPAQVVHNWADGSAIRPLAAEASALRRAWGFSGRFVVGYSGNLGRSHEWETALAAAGHLREDAGIVFSFVGGGYHFENLRRAALPNVVLREYVAAAELSDALAASDVHLITQLPALEGLAVPSKFYSAMAAGRPVIFVGDADGEIARTIGRHDCGIAVQAGDAAALMDAILRLRNEPALREAMGARARAAFESGYDRPVALARWQQLLTSLPR